jgi:hypothetical protein
MSTAKIEFAVGSLSFSGEATEEWLAKQLDKLLKHAETLPVVASSTTEANDPPVNAQTSNGIASTTLVAFLQKHGATTNQTKKFLAIALWVMAKQGKTTFSTKDVTLALTNAQQQKLGNASQCMANVLKSGQVEKGPGGECYVTPEGKKSLGIAE